MARPIRIEYAGALYHVTSRGDRREDIFVDDEDRLIWLDIFTQVCSRYNWRCHEKNRGAGLAIKRFCTVVI